ncbi:5,6-dimethylbenzimidazole synthase [Conexibacter sp. JD483]|uniref:5,6-dimethylbenzimidazole synthase n=1 Tax=unclassified Conexibacter TaxID=2627773 RepID=UPI002721D1FA|nr:MULTISPECIES: 5,6-dimethylbenzimidazole synthase [unclassified Conexibacter]MDO8189441.1 5,6-dimethylbenzimidazole synthase [Conexibacter sp. CPCC 205706]MDO8202030.1 5,6-dimethylbenzimidazole synthase [Conexibacter sp. CPCC 205762]MDR9372586.1 5,6-dimethylbenzimidazole synthase [Conexibacter sp. JD483]
MSSDPRQPRPATPAGFDPSRAADRAADPTGWRYPAEARESVYRAIAERRDIRRFRPDPVPADVLERILAAAHKAPSVGLMQPWRLIVVRELETKLALRRLAQRERLRQAERFDERAGHFLDQKIEGIVEAPLGICVCCDHGDPGAEVLGRGTIPETDVYSAACAIQNLWLAARAEGLGIGWVSFYRPDDLRALLDIPARVDPMAWLCVGWPDERPVRPGLEAAGWSSRLPLDAVVMDERWDASAPSSAQAAPASAQAAPSSAQDAPAGRAAAPDRAAAIAARDRSDQLAKPAGSLGALEALIERWASVTGAAPPARPRAGVLVAAADHGHVVHGTSLFDAAVSAQVAAAAARGQSAVGVLVRRDGHELLVADVGLVAATPAGVRAAKLAPGTADMTAGPALTDAQLDAALALGATLAEELAARGADCLVLGEIGIGNTTTTAALAGALLNLPAARTVGRGTGLDAAGLDRKRAVVDAALARARASARRDAAGASPSPAALDPRAALREVGGLELAVLAGAVIAGSRLRLPVILDGYAVTTAALAAVGLEPAVAESLIASHRSAEPGHARVLAELGLEPLLDLRLRLGEASGALLALPVIAAAGALHREMATFAEAEIDDPR